MHVTRYKVNLWGTLHHFTVDGDQDLVEADRGPHPRHIIRPVAVVSHSRVGHRDLVPPLVLLVPRAVLRDNLELQRLSSGRKPQPVAHNVAPPCVRWPLNDLERKVLPHLVLPEKNADDVCPCKHCWLKVCEYDVVPRVLSLLPPFLRRRDFDLSGEGHEAFRLYALGELGCRGEEGDLGVRGIEGLAGVEAGHWHVIDAKHKVPRVQLRPLVLARGAGEGRHGALGHRCHLPVRSGRVVDGEERHAAVLNHKRHLCLVHD
mmetsp:Transcript_509/g.1207  ORF Transcript_509/g.1207 Transcript_509/m.1207 type:complete len:261 (+) Transcript_509:2796-3578(+)